MAELQMWTADGCEEFIIAETAEEARGVVVAMCGDYEELDPLSKWYAMPLDKEFTYDDDGKIIRKTIREFIATSPRGYFASTNY